MPIVYHDHRTFNKRKGISHIIWCSGQINFLLFLWRQKTFYAMSDSSLSYKPYEIKFIFWEAQSINFELDNVCSYWMAISKNETINTFMINLMIIAYICLGILATFIKNTIMDWISQNLPNFYLSNHRPCIQYVWNLVTSYFSR